MNGKIMSEETEKVIKVTPEETEKSINTNQESATFLVIGDKAYTSEIIEEYNRNAEAKTEDFNTNAENKTASYNSNAADRTTAFNNNYDNKISAFNSNANKQTEEFDSHVLMQTNTFNNNAASTIANYNSNAEQKTTEFNQNALSYQEGIDANKKHIINVSNELERVKNDILETGTDTDTYIHLEDSAMAEYQELEIEGKSLQDGTPTPTAPIEIQNVEGVTNLLPNNITTQELNGVTITRNEDDSLTLNGTATRSFGINISELLTFSAGTYTISLTNPIPSKVYISLDNIDGTMLNHNFRLSHTWTLTEDKTYNRCLLFLDAGAVLDNYLLTPMVNKGNIAKPYVPYGRWLKVKSVGRNILDYSNIETGTKNGITCTYDKNMQEITLNGTCNGDNTYFKFHKDKDITGVNGYYQTAYWVSGSATGVVVFKTDNANWNSSKSVNLTELNANTKTVSAKITTDTVRNFWLELKLGAVCNNLKIKLCFSATTEYEPYQENTELIDMNIYDEEGNIIGYRELCAIGDVKDTLKVEYNEEDAQYHSNLYKNIGKVVLDGSESWNGNVATTSTDYLYVYANTYDSFIAYDNRGYCNIARKYRDILLVSSEVDGAYFSIGGSEHRIRMFIPLSVASTIEEWKTYLSENPVTLYYILATPVEIDLGAVDMPITYNEITNLFTDSDLLPQINAKYYRNFITTIQNLQVNEKALKQELIDINTRLSALESSQTSTTSESEVI